MVAPVRPGGFAPAIFSFLLLTGACKNSNPPAPPVSEPAAGQVVSANRPTLQALSIYLATQPASRILGGRNDTLRELKDTADIPEEIRKRTKLTGNAGPNLIPAVLGEVVEIVGTPTGHECDNIKEVNYNRIQPGGVLKDDVKIEIQPLTRNYFDDVIQKQVGNDIGFLGFTASMATNDRAEVLIQDVAGMEISSFNTQADPALKAATDPPLPANVCGRYVLTSAVAAAISHRVYSDKTVKGAVVSVLNIGGHAYNSRDKQQTEYLIGIGLQPLKLATGLTGAPKTLDPSLFKR